MACDEPWNDGLAFSKISRNKRAKPRAITPLATGRWPSRGIHLDGVRNAARKSQSVHLAAITVGVSTSGLIPPLLAIIMVHCRIESAGCLGPPCRRNPNLSRKKQLDFRCGKEITRERNVHSSTCHNSASAMRCSPSYNHQPRAQLGESEHHTISFHITVPCRCHDFSKVRCETGPCPCLGTVRPPRVHLAEITAPARRK